MKETLASQQIEAVLSTNWENFKIWQNQNGAKQTLNIPRNAAQVFIPRRLLELSEDPKNVHALLTKRSPHSISVVIFERLSKTLTSPEKYNGWIESHKEQRLIVFPSSQEESPEGVDYKHIRFTGLLESGKLTFNDRVFINYSAYIPNGCPGVVFTQYFEDRTEFQRKGIGSSFYERLETVLRQLEFKYLVGDVISPHPGFFEKQRTPYPKLPDAVKKELSFLDPGLHSSSHNFMVKVL